MYCFNTTIFRRAIPAFFSRFTDVTEFMMKMTNYIEMENVAMTYNIKKKRTANKDIGYNNSSRLFRP